MSADVQERLHMSGRVKAVVVIVIITINLCCYSIRTAEHVRLSHCTRSNDQGIDSHEVDNKSNLCAKGT